MRTRVEKLRSPPVPAAGPKVILATIGSGFLSMNSVSDLESLLDLGRHAHGERHQRRVVGGPGRIEHHHAVLGADRPVAESLLLERRPNRPRRPPPQGLARQCERGNGRDAKARLLSESVMAPFS